MADDNRKKEKRTEVKSSSFKEIIDGEVVSEPQPKKALEKPVPKPGKKPAEKPKEKMDKEFVESMIAASKPPQKPQAARKAERRTGFRIIENGEYIDGSEGLEATPHGDVISTPEAKNITDEAEEEPDKVKKSLKYSSIDGVFNSASGSIQTSFTTPFALALGASNAQIGILNSLENLTATVAQVPGAMLTKFWSRKRIWLVSQVLAKILIWIPIMLLPFAAVENRVMILIGLLALSNFFLYIRSPAWSSLMGDLVSLNIRGRYFGRRNMLVGISGVVATLAAGFILAYWGFTAIFFISILISVVAIFFFMKMYEPPVKKVFHYKYAPSFKMKGWWTSIRVNREFVLFTVYLASMNFAIDVAAPFYAVYMLKNLSIGYEWFAVAVVVGALAKALSNKYWGRLNDRFGSRKILIITGILGCFVPFGWMLASSLLHVFIIKIYDGLVFSGFELVIFNYLLEVTPAKNRPKYVAAHNFFTGIGTVLGDIFGALLVVVFEGSGFFLLAGLQVVFLASFVLRLSCLSFFVLIKNIDVKQSDLVPVRYVFWQAVAVEPARGIKHAIVFTFRYPPKVERELRDSVKKLESRLKLKMNA